MARKLIIDCDPGIDDAVALCQALFDPRLEVLAVTAVAGNVPAELASQNVQSIIDHLDPARTPRIGIASPPNAGHVVDARHIHGDDGLGNVALAHTRHHQQHAAEKLISDTVRAYPDEVSLLCLGPLTNAARALRRDPQVASQLDELVIMGGSIQAGGNITPAAEFNVYCDPLSAREVFLADINKRLVPLDVTRQVMFGMDLLNQLPAESTRAGWLLRAALPQVYRAYHELLGQERVNLHDAVAILAITDPELFEQQSMAGDVETAQGLSLGATVFDRRPNQAWQNNMLVARTVDATAAAQRIVQALQRAGEQTRSA